VSLAGSELPDWQRQLQRPEVKARLRAVPEDFQVWELPLIEPEGRGSHLWLEICKRCANTQWVASQLAAAAGVSARDVGFAGMKDRHAVTTQWFSVGLQEGENDNWREWDIPGVTILQARRHGRKLQRGALRGNRFRLVLRDLQGAMDSLEARLESIRRTGVPNYFGPQRFGRQGANIPRAARWLERGQRISRNQRSIYLSAVRSYMFNQVLAERVSLGIWNRLINGDLAMLDGSRSVFPCRLPDRELERRCAEFDIHPTGPLPGRAGKRGNSETAGEAAALEAAVLNHCDALLRALRGAGVDASRRSLRVVPGDLEWQWGECCLALEFSLPPGAYATSVLRELVLADPDTISEDT
jgi:tRNA pseudouridine13 synthase